MSKTSESSYNREAELEKEFNNFWAEWHKKNGRLTQNMPLESIILLKSALHSINNIATLKITELLVDKLATWFPKRFKAVRKDILDVIRKEKPNSNGYDIQFETNELAFIAEIKCNIPFQEDGKGWKFGANQVEGIKTDIEGLKNGKTTATLRKGIKHYKFLGVYDYAGRSKGAMERILQTDRVKKCGQVEFLVKETELNPNVIYIVMLGND